MVTVAFDGFPTLVVSLRGPLVTVRNFHVTSLSASSSSSSSSRWKQVIDPKSAQPYYWNTETNKTSWEIPEGWMQENCDDHDDDDANAKLPESTKLPLEELTSVLLKAVAGDSSRFGDVANQYRPQCFDNQYFDYLTNIINSTQDNDKKEALERLRARLANPLLKNPPPY